ncbi:hypothetical protein C7410_123101 [Paraburkholderia silvatlantica]|uniref:Uncharacterized protein n=1 Tax=Paraburkholderia silvatlantica TaxID=321895 RepID=A0A2V4TNW0_9BURK|nr:hypothetical protein C7410_123101 [Paraburkholderia silvatlantica]
MGMTPMTAKGWFRANDSTDLTQKPIGYMLNLNAVGKNVHIKVDDPEERYTGIVGSGPFAERGPTVGMGGEVG